MLFKKLFIATLAALALVGCNDDNDIDNPVLQDAGDVNVVFATSSSEQGVTKSDVTFRTYGNFTPTDDVYEYCLKKKVIDPEFVIDHMTVFVFDAESGGLVKTAYFKDVLTEKKGSSMKLPETEDGANSIYEFGGIVLKAGTYNFILAGNLTKAQIKAEGETFEDYKSAAIAWGGDNGISSQITNTYLPMVKVLNKIKLIAREKTANATLNLIKDNTTEEELEAVAPDTNTDESQLSAPAIQLTRLVARIQLKSLAFNWTVTGEGGETPAASITLRKVYLANASNTSVLTGVNEGEGYVHGFDVTTDMFFQEGTVDAGNLSEELADVVTIENGKQRKEWVSARTEAKEDTDLLPLSFYAFGKTIEANDNDLNLTMVLECSAAYNTSAGTVPDKSVYYYVPIRKKENNEDNEDKEILVANKVYNVNVTLTGQGSDENGKKQDKVNNLTFGLSVGNWNGPVTITIDEKPTPVNN